MPDKRTVKTVNAIRNAFTDMLVKSNNVYLSIKDIAEKANINRKTFYLHFQCIEDLYQDLEKITEEKLLALLNERNFFTSNFSIRIFLDALLELINQNEKLYEKLLINDDYKFLFRNVKDKIKEKVFVQVNAEKENLKADMCAEYICSGLMKLFRVWASRKDEMTTEELIETAHTLIKHGILGIVNNQ